MFLRFHPHILTRKFRIDKYILALREIEQTPQLIEFPYKKEEQRLID